MRRFLTSLFTLAILSSQLLAIDELCLTNNAMGTSNLPVSYTVKPDGLVQLFDGSFADTNSANLAQDTSLTLTFAEPVRISRVQVVYFNDKDNGYNGVRQARVAGMRNQTVVESSPWVSLQQDGASLLFGTDWRMVIGLMTDLPLAGNTAVDAVKLDIEKMPQAQQCLIREVYVWGVPERLAHAPAVSIPFTAVDSTYSSIQVTWATVPPKTAYVRVRYRQQGTTAWSAVACTTSPALLHWLTPQNSYEVAVDAVGGKSTSTKAMTKTIALPGPLGVRRMGDLWGMNFYPDGGGGSHQRRDDEVAMSRKMVALMQQAGVRHVRWWWMSPSMSDTLARSGMTLLPTVFYPFSYPEAKDPRYFERLIHNAGIWVIGTTNEPDFQNCFAKDYLDILPPVALAARQVSPMITLTGPAVGGELVGPGSDYLQECYERGLKDAIGALDIHPYAKNATPVQLGGRMGSPENLLLGVRTCQQVMAANHVAQRPIIVSETGHSTFIGKWHAPAVTLEQQAQYVVRNHLLMAASGVRRVFWYCFQDEGADKNNPEHNFGLVDYQGNPKPAFTSYCVMTRLLSNAVCQGLDANVKPPVYAVRCSVQGGYITTIWDGGGSSRVEFDRSTKITKIISLTGSALSIPRAKGKTIPLTVDENVRYVFSPRPLRITTQQRIAPVLEPQVTMRLIPSTVSVQAGKPCQWQVEVTSTFDCPLTATVLLDWPPWDNALAQQEISLPPHGKTVVTLSVPPPTDMKPLITSREIHCRYQPADTRWHAGESRRAIYFTVPK